MAIAVKHALDSASKRLMAAGSPTPELDAQILLAHALDCDRTFLLTHFNDILGSSELVNFDKLICRRETREPVAYLTGCKEFYSLDFKVDQRALIPRPETETIIGAALELYDQAPITALDIGTGSGAIAITLARHRPNWQVTAIDLCNDALELARENMNLHNVDNLKLVQSDLYGSLGGQKFDLIVTNPPYVVEGERNIDPEARLYEPGRALYSGEDGLNVIRRIIGDSASNLNPDGRIIMEFGDGQAEQIAALFEQNIACKVEQVITDLAGFDRVIVVSKRAG